jgi:hypothetical protein
MVKIILNVLIGAIFGGLTVYIGLWIWAGERPKFNWEKPDQKNVDSN